MFFNNPRAFAWAFWLSCGSPRSASSLIDSRVLGSTRAVPFFFKDHPFFAVHALCVFAVWVRQTHVPPPQGGFIRLVVLQGVAVVLFRCAVGVGACPGGLLLITGSDWSATCAFRRHGIQEIGLPPARLGASPTCCWPHTSATPK